MRADRQAGLRRPSGLTIPPSPRWDVHPKLLWGSGFGVQSVHGVTGHRDSHERLADCLQCLLRLAFRFEHRQAVAVLLVFEPRALDEA